MPLQFNTAYYLQQNPDVAAAIDSGAITDARSHFDNFGAAEGRDPNANFDVSYYLAQNPDVAAAFENGVINPFDHFLRFGASENRAPSANLELVAAGFDEEAYLAANEDVAAAVESGVFANGYQHWVVYGRYEDSRPEATFNGGTPVSDVADAIDATELTAALNALNTAQENLATKLAGLELDTNADGSIDVQAGDATVQNVEASLTAFTTELDTELAAISTNIDANDFTAGGENTKAGLIADGRAAGNAAITTAQQSVTTAERGLASGELTALNTVNSRIAQLEAATDAANAADVAENGELAKFQAVNQSKGTIEVNENSVVFTPTDGTPTDIATLNDNGSWQAVSGTGLNLSGLNTYLTALQAQTATATAQTTAESNLDNAILQVVRIENPNSTNLTVDNLGDNVVSSATTDGKTVVTVDLTDTTDGDSSGNIVTAPNAQGVLDARSALTEAQTELADLNEAIANYQAANQLDSEVGQLDDAVTAASAAITDPEADGGLGVNLITDYTDATNGSDVFLFSQNDAPQTVGNFGDSGLDRIFFGEGYNFVQIPDGSQITNNVGDSSALEIFWQQEGGNLNLFVEDQTFGGNSSGVADVTEITLTGVTADEVNFANGYLSAGQMA
ncbi:hypothetical protein ACUN8C_04290 [Kushneria sp. Sum13]|uniref:hypothetical protein n=1 Tax=Kushneria sp. Sum13 TaxID=3459196 RepID=UPI004045BF8A